MTAITHHCPETLMAAYATGRLAPPFALVVAAHLSLCDPCRAAYEAHQVAGGALLEDGAPAPLSEGLRAEVLNRLDRPAAPSSAAPSSAASRPARPVALPGPVVEALHGQPPRWTALGLGVRQCILTAGRAGSVRLLSIPAGQAVPDHGHGGLELTLVLQGRFSDETGRFGVGDLQVANGDVIHSPVADAAAPCLCLAATDAPLRFRGLIPRLLQPLFRI